jgi:hypothetical protein
MHLGLRTPPTSYICPSGKRHSIAMNEILNDGEEENDIEISNSIALDDIKPDNSL